MTETLNATRRKIVGEPDAGKSHVRFEVAGGGDQRMGRIFRHSQRKRRATGLSSLNARRHSLTLPADAAGSGACEIAHYRERGAALSKHYPPAPRLKPKPLGRP